MNIKLRLVAVMIAAALTFVLTSCRGPISDDPSPIGSSDPAESLTPDFSGDTQQTLPEPTESDPRVIGELYGSYLTMYYGQTPLEERSEPKFTVFHSYQEVSDYYDSICLEYFCGARFTMLLGSFTDEFLSENDVMVLSISEPSSYLNHTADPIVITDTEVKINITRHIAEGAPLLNTQYHLVFTAPKGGFDGADGKELVLTISEVTDSNNSAYDAERYRIYYPEYLNFCYRADAITDPVVKAVDIIDGYDELVYFFETNRGDFDLDDTFRDYIGPLYNWQICERYILLATLIPCSDEQEPVTSDLFINNLEIFMTVKANEAEEGKKPRAGYLLLTAIERSELQGVDFSSMNLLIEPHDEE